MCTIFWLKEQWYKQQNMSLLIKHGLFDVGQAIPDPSISRKLEVCTTKQQVYRCDLCVASYYDMHTLEYHINLHSDNDSESIVYLLKH